MFTYLSVLYSFAGIILSHILIFFLSVFNTLVEFTQLIFSQENLSELLQGSTIAIITIFISFAIPLFSEAFKMNEDEGSLDLYVALDYVWRFKETLFYFLISLLVPIFIIKLNLISLIAFVIWIFGFIKLIKTTLRSYKWAKGNKNDFRFEYLGTSIKNSDILPVWKSFLSKKKLLNFSDEERFLDLFFKKINTLILSDSSDDLEILNKLLSEFNLHIENRNIQFLYLSDNLIKNIIDWHYIIWGRTWKTNKIKKDLFLAQENLESIFDHLQKQVFKEDSQIFPLFFTNKLVRLNRYQNVKIKKDGKEIPYIYHMPLHPTEFITDTLEYPSSRNIWDNNFPEEWKITLENWKGSNNSMVRFWLLGFMSWLADSYERNELKWKVDSIIKGLFPSVELYVWSGILRLALFKPGGVDSFKYLIEKEVNFGNMGRVYTGIYSIDDNESMDIDYKNQSDAQKENSYKLALEIFSFSEKNLNFWLSLIEQIHYSKDSKYYHDRNSFENLLKELLNNLNK